MTQQLHARREIAADHYQKTYGLSATHSEVRGLEPYLAAAGGTALDLGCGRGRNSLYLHDRGYALTSFDKNPDAIAKLQEIIAAEGIADGLHAAEHNLEELAFGRPEHYDIVLSTVVFQFLDPKVIDGLVAAMQSSTKPGGLNLIVGPMSTPDVPCPLNLPFTFKEGQLENYYEGWEFLKYNENMGEFHRKDEHGNNMKCKFATIVARKP